MPLNMEEMGTVEKKIHRSACFQRTFSEAEGQKVLDWIDVFTGYKNDTFDPDPYVSARKAGMRVVSIFIHNVIEQDVEELTERLKKEKKK